ncbi:MAG TPA: zinc-dependent peptidase [Thiobacillaceae bacterium]|nr:zinc-dependent peptidase [Thiobacillaceae bacterium]
MISLLRALFSRTMPVPAPTTDEWAAALDLPVFAGFPAVDRRHLLLLAQELLAGKRFSPVAGADPGGLDIAAIVTQAALPILHLGTRWYRGWNEVVLYPGEFAHEGDETDEFGIVHRVRHVRSGEAWEGGPLVLSLDSVRMSGHREGYNVVIHEFAHKLDMNSGSVNGFPPLHADMRREAWSTAFATAYADLRASLARPQGMEDSEIDPYAAESPAEFFAVMSEYFFEWPELVFATYPAVYAQLCQFYRQDTLRRLSSFPVQPIGAIE